ncbi:MAG: hypothetical protein EA385_00920 [Salinarimonadaceae bacterium]|nr:MAG: hypothetical protein EA385_00920 [Salinarimonadaceae bacterium]
MMKPIITAAGAALIAITMTPVTASASAPGYVTTHLNVRAGPGTQFPAVAVFPPGARVNVIGCTRGFRWCDVSARGIRGWVSAAYLEVNHRNRRARAPAIAAHIGLPIITFQIGSYWDSHYRAHSWYSQRTRYGGPRVRSERRQEQVAPTWEHRRGDGRRSSR